MAHRGVSDAVALSAGLARGDYSFLACCSSSGTGRPRSEARLYELGLKPGSRYAVIQPTSKFFTKEWTHEGFAETADLPRQGTWFPGALIRRARGRGEAAECRGALSGRRSRVLGCFGWGAPLGSSWSKTFRRQRQRADSSCRCPWRSNRGLVWIVGRGGLGILGRRRFSESRILSTATPARAIAALSTTSRNASSASRRRRLRYPSMPPYARPLRR